MGNVASTTFLTGNIGVPLSASKDVTETVGEINTAELESVNGDCACTTTTIPTSMADIASASGVTATETRNKELDGIIDAIADDERKRLTPCTKEGACSVTTAY
jgi:hypothetical protein